MARTTGRLTVTVPLTLIRDLDILCESMGVSRSALMSLILTEPVAQMRHVVAAMRPLYPDEPFNARYLRARGESERVIGERVSDMRGKFDALDKGGV